MNCMSVQPPTTLNRARWITSPNSAACGPVERNTSAKVPEDAEAKATLTGHDEWDREPPWCPLAR